MQATTTANPAGSVTARFSGLPKELKVKIVAMAQENDLDWTRSPYVKWCEPELSSYETWRSMASRDSIKALLSVNKELNDLAAEHYFSVSRSTCGDDTRTDLWPRCTTKLLTLLVGPDFHNDSNITYDVGR